MAEDRPHTRVPSRSASPDPVDRDESAGGSATAAEDAAIEAARESADTASAEAVEDPEYSSQSESAALAAQAIGVGGAAGELRAGERRTHAAGYRELLRLSWPIMLSQVLVTAVSLIDIAMVGRLGPKAVAAVGYATQFFFMTQSALFAVGFACVALMARAIGAGDPAEARRSLGASLVVGVGTAVIVGAAVLAAPAKLLALLNAEPEVVTMTVPYMRLVLGSTLLLAISLVLENGMRANRDMVRPMIIASAVAALKIWLNAYLIFGMWGGPRLELIGAGIATVASQVFGLVLFVIVIARAPRGGPLALTLADIRAPYALVRRVVRVAAPGVAERIVLNLALLDYFAILGNYGTVVVAAYTVGVRALSFSWIPGTGIAAAVATLVGHALGAGDEKEAVRIGRRSAVLAIAVAIVLGIVGGLARMPIAHMFTDDRATIAALGPFLLCLAISQPMLQLHFTLAGVHRGAGDTWTPLIAATVGNWGFRVPLAAFFAHVLHTSVSWLWVALIFDHIARAAWLTVTFQRGKWLRRADVVGRTHARRP
jgi:putative MATE family efflux protein